MPCRPLHAAAAAAAACIIVGSEAAGRASGESSSHFERHIAAALLDQGGYITLLTQVAE